MAAEDKKEGKPGLVALTIDGKDVSVAAGTNLIEAARRVGILIPHYCYHPSLSIDGSCRLCLVEVEGMPKLTIACNSEVRGGMVVHTDTEPVLEARRGMMEFLLVNHPLDCPVCDRGGECQLQRYSMDHGPADQRTVDERRAFPKEEFDPLIDLERNRCIVCQRCVRFLDEIGGERLLGVYNRGNRDMIASYENGPVSTNIFSGNIVDLCPVGALTSKPFRFQARPWELQQVQGTCALCSAGCKVTHWTRGDRLLRTTAPTRPAPLNFKMDEDTSGFICNVGRFGSACVNGDGRLTAPAVGGAETSWETAIDAVASRLKGVIGEHGPDAVGFLVSPRRSCEELYLLSRLARAGVGTNNIDWRGAALDPEAARAQSVAFNYANGQLERPEEYDTILVVDADVGAQAPVTALKLKEAARRGRTNVIAIGHRHDEWFASRVSQNLVVHPDRLPRILELLSGVLQDAEGEEENGETLEKLSRLAAVPLEAMQALIARLKATKHGLILYGVSGLSGLNAARLTHACLNFAIPLASYWHTLPFVGERNARGAFGVGAQPDRLPRGFADDAETASRTGELWGCSIPENPGLCGVEMLHAAAEGRLKALYVLGADVLKDFPDRELVERATERLELLVVQDVFTSALSAKAHVTLPASSFVEAEGAYADLSGKLTRSASGPPVSGGPHGVVASLSALIGALGKTACLAATPAEVFQEMAQALELPCPLEYGELSPEGPGDECPIRCRTAPRRKHRAIEGKFFSYVSEFEPQCHLPVGARQQTKWEYKPAAGPPLVENPNELVLAWAPQLLGADPWLDRVEALAPVLGEGEVELHPDTARKLGLQDGDAVVVGEDGEGLRGQLKVSEYVAPGVVFLAQNRFPIELGAETRTLPNVKVVKAES